MVSFLPSHSLPHLCGPESHPKLLFFTSCYHSRVTSSAMVSSPLNCWFSLHLGPGISPHIQPPCPEGSLENPISAQSPHPSTHYPYHLSRTNPSQSPQTSVFDCADQALQFHTLLIHTTLFPLWVLWPRTDSMPNVNASATNWSL